MKEIDAAELRAAVLKLTVTECRSKAADSLVRVQKMVDDEGGVTDIPEIATQLHVANVWATLALSCALPQAPAPENPIDHECCHTSQRLPGVRLYAVGDPEPQVNPGALYVDPSGTGARYLLRIDGEGDREWLWCDSLANAEATLRDAGTWATAMGCGIIRVREATEREEVEFREGTGGAALDLVRRLLSTLAGIARDHQRPDVAQWLADCDAAAHTAFHTWLWPRPLEAEDPNNHARYGAVTALRRAAQMAPGAPNGPDWSQWLLACAREGIGPEAGTWPAPPSKVRPDMLTVRVENPRPDLERLTLDTIGRLRGVIDELVAERT